MSGVAAKASASAVVQAAAEIGVFTAMSLGWLRAEIANVALVVLAVAWPPAVRWRPAAVRSVLRTYLPFAAAWLLFVIVYLRLLHLFGLPARPQPLLRQIADGGLGDPTAIGIVAGIVVIAPVCEEIVFRGYLWTGLRRLLPVTLAHVLTAAIFGLFHGWHYALPIALLGLLFGFLRARHDALLPAIYAHALHNGLTVAVTALWPGHLELLYPR